MRKESSSTKSEFERSLKALRKKALGYTAQEVIEEYATVDGEMSLVKKKVTTKDVPPDLSAIKAYLEMSESSDLSSMSLDELIAERERLLNELYSKQNSQKE